MPAGGDRLDMSISDCLPHANIWIQSWFNECIYTPWDLVAFVIGLSSVCFWIVAQVPQFMRNLSRQSADGLSPWFLVQWLAGDASNLIGCLLTGDQLATETMTAAYFIFADCVILSQYLYYSYKGRKQPAGYGSDSDESLHKPPNGYYESLQNGEAARLEKLLESTMATEGAHSQLCILEPKTSQATKPSVIDSGKTIVRFKHASISKESNPIAESRGNFRCCSCNTRTDNLRRNMPFSSGLSVLQKHQQDCCFANDQKANLKRVVGQYGLEYSITLWKKNSKRYMLSSGKHCDHAPSHVRKSRVKAAFCFTGLLILASFSWQSFSSVPNFRSNIIPNENEFAVLGRRNLKELQEEDQGLSQRTLLAISGSASLWTRDIGLLFGWASSVFYLSSRVSQLLENISRKSANGLSLGMVGCAVMANLTYGVAILMLITSWGDLFSKFPWLLGSLGTVSLDLIILMQAYYFSCRYGKNTNESTPFLA